MSALTREERIALERACEQRVEWLTEHPDVEHSVELRPGVLSVSGWRIERLAERECLRSVLRRLRCGEPLEGP